MSLGTRLNPEVLSATVVCCAPCTPHLKLIEPLLWQCLHCTTMLILHYLLPPVFEARGLARDGTTLDTYVKVEFVCSVCDLNSNYPVTLNEPL